MRYQYALGPYPEAMLSTPSLGITGLGVLVQAFCVGDSCFQLPLSGSQEWPEEMPADIFTADFQLPLSGSHECINTYYPRDMRLSTPSLGIT